MNLKPFLRANYAAVLAVILILLGMGIRISWLNQSALWCDEAESCINALTILQTGVPGWKYLDLPVFENTLTQSWDGNPEYEFRDSTYSDKGVVVYHGWLPIYAIAASQALFGIRPDVVHSPPKVLHGPEETAWRTTIPRLPALLFSLLCMIVIYRLGSELGGPVAGLGALALMALNARTVDFGIQARYYSLTLLMNAVAAWYLFQTIRSGRWSDFLGLGISAGLLFHTHLFSTVVFAMVGVFATPWILRRPNWFWKSLAGGAVAMGLVVPWILLTGFLDTASSVPKVFKLFESPYDALFYIIERPVPTICVIAVALLLLVSYRKKEWLPAVMSGAFREHGSIYFLLLAWLASSYAAFHVIVPAASFFYERLSLSLWVPFVLALSLFLSDVLRLVPPKIAMPLAILLLTLFLGARSRLAFSEETSLTQKRPATAALTEALQKMTFEEKTRFFATPNDHLTHTYYTGLPVQSVAPIRKSFFESYEYPVVFIETQMDTFFPSDTDLQNLFSTYGWKYSDAASWEMGKMIWEWKIWTELHARNLTPLPPEPLPHWLQPLGDKTANDYNVWKVDYFESLQSSPILRGLPAGNVKEVWLGFFYRFVDPELRLGENTNIFPRLRNAEIIPLPSASKVIFLSSNPP